MTHDLERMLADVWREVLAVDHVDADQNFFDAGARSETMEVARDRLSAALGRRVPLVTLYEHPTIRALARHLATPVRP